MGTIIGASDTSSDAIFERASYADGRRPLGRLVAVLPAHDEEQNVGAAIGSLLSQTRPPDRVVVLADNCTDATPEVAAGAGADVFVPRANRDKKAGALNQWLDQHLDVLDADDLVLVMDADCTLDPTFLATALGHLEDPRFGGVGGVFRGGPGGGLLGTFQRNEYARYERDVRRLKGRALVLTGTASVFPVAVLKHVRAARRAGLLPDSSRGGQVYDTAVLTEDNELSLALMHLGYDILAPAECTLETEVMETWKQLHDQRLRWKRGALENLFDYGWTSVTRPYWGRQLLSLLGVLATVLYVGSLGVGLVVGIQLHWFWLTLSLVFVVERVVTVRSRGWRQQLLAAPLVIEMIFDLFLQVVQGRAFTQAVLRSERKW